MNATANTLGPGCGPASAQLTEMVDVAFGLAGESLPRDYELPLFREIARILPWVLKTPRAGILPMKGPRSPEGGVMITHRSRLVIRLPRDRVCSASALEREELRVGGVTLKVGEGSFRKHLGAPTLYSPRVTTGEADEVRFLAVLEEEIAALGVRGRLICGRRVEVQLEEGRAPAFPVAVHDLREPDSLLLQRAGLGRGQAVGCGLLVPHKTIVAAE
ncbi:MAG: type I-MYXAN CRISPR-associated protein Cas6/Cmx6 [Betaproteobacteria bacterium]|nr:type I-MYXAN CRISPR-associated protein Cas6/Cmx6 [Betaproteobacteria bacterium]